MNLSNIARFWGVVLLLIFGALWLLKDMLAPFVVGLAIAYLLDPIVERLIKKCRLPRWSAVSFVLLVFTIFLGLVGALVVPFIIEEIISFYKNLPFYTNKLIELSQPSLESILSHIGPDGVEKAKAEITKNIGTFFSGVGDVINQVWSSGLAIIDVVSFLIITPIVAFYCMLDWPKIRQAFDDLLPRRHLKTIRGLMVQFDDTLSGFIRGQTMVCLVLGLFYAVGLTAAGLNYGIAIGFMAGILSFVPYVGSFFGLVTSVGVAVVQFDGYAMPAVIAAIFFAGQAVEGNVLTPRLVGQQVGLHAVWVIFALMAGGSLLGFTGLLLAVPLAALIGILVRFGITWYKDSIYYAAPKKLTKKRKRKK